MRKSAWSWLEPPWAFLSTSYSYLVSETIEGKEIIKIIKTVFQISAMPHQVVPGSLASLPQHRHHSPLHDEYSHFRHSTRALQADWISTIGPGCGYDPPHWKSLQHLCWNGTAVALGVSTRALSGQRGDEEVPVGLRVLPRGSSEERERTPGEDGATPVLQQGGGVRSEYRKYRALRWII